MIITRTVTSPRPVATDTAQVLRGRRYLIVASWSFLLLIALMARDR